MQRINIIGTVCTNGGIIMHAEPQQIEVALAPFCEIDSAFVCSGGLFDGTMFFINSTDLRLAGEMEHKLCVLQPMNDNLPMKIGHPVTVTTDSLGNVAVRDFINYLTGKINEGFYAWAWPVVFIKLKGTLNG